MATLKDVANRAGVSVTTVSLIINGKAKERKISEKTEQRVKEIIKEINYQPSLSARSLRKVNEQVFTIGVYWVSDYRMEFLSRFMAGIQKFIVESGAQVNVVICPYKIGELYKETRLYDRVSFNAVIIANMSEKDLLYIENHPLPIPAVLNNRFSNQYHTVKIDNSEAGRMAARYLSNRGVKSVKVISLGRGYWAQSSSVDGFISEFQQCGKENVVEVVNVGVSIHDGVAVGKQLHKYELPDAIFCNNETTAIGIIYALEREKIRIPEDIQILSLNVGNPEYTEFISTPATIIDIPLDKMAFECMQVVTAIVCQQEEDFIHIEFPPTLYERASTR